MVSRCRAVGLGLALVAAAAGHAAARPGGPPREAKKLQGTWVVLSATLDGRDVTDLKGGRVVIAGDKLTIRPESGMDEEEFTFTVDPTRKPKAMRLAFVKTPSKAAAHVIYDLDGDDLKFVLGQPDKRPTEFTDKGHALLTLKRKK
jgi:uncharacterized protein (TIGR03067 family)